MPSAPTSLIVTINLGTPTLHYYAINQSSCLEHMRDANLSGEVENLHEDHTADVLDEKDGTNLRDYAMFVTRSGRERLAVVNRRSVEDQEKNRLSLSSNCGERHLAVRSATKLQHVVTPCNTFSKDNVAMERPFYLSQNKSQNGVIYIYSTFLYSSFLEGC